MANYVLCIKMSCCICNRTKEFKLESKHCLTWLYDCKKLQSQFNISKFIHYSLLKNRTILLSNVYTVELTNVCVFLKIFVMYVLYHGYT